jgi:hypothetical protein
MKLSIHIRVIVHEIEKKQHIEHACNDDDDVLNENTFNFELATIKTYNALFE